MRGVTTCRSLVISVTTGVDKFPIGIQSCSQISTTGPGYVMATEGDKADGRREGRLAVDIEREEYSVPWQGVTYEATYSGRRYPCVVAIHHLQMKIGKAALAEFSARLPDVARATENILRAVQPEADEETRKSTDRIIVPLGS